MNFFKSASYVLTANALVLLLSFIIRPFIARFLGPSEYGVFALVLSTAAVIPAFTLFSMNSGVLYHVSKTPNKTKEIVGTVLTFVIAVSILIFIPLQVLIQLFFPALGFDSYLTAFLLSFGLSCFAVLQAVLQGLEKFSKYSKYSVISTLVAGLFSAGAALYFQTGVAAAFARAIAMIVVSLFGFYALKAFGKFDRKTFSKLFDYSKPLALAGLVAAFIVVVDRYFLAAYHGTAEVGFYDISYSMVAAVLPFSSSLLTIMMPRVIREQHNLGLYYKKLGQANTLLLSIIGLFFFYYSDIIVTILLGQTYQPAAITFKILAFALPLMSFYGLNGASLDAVAQTKVSGLLAALLTVFSILFNFFLVPTLGATGAALANLLTYTVIVSLGFYYLKSRRNVDLRGSALQYGLFVAFALAYFFFVEQYGFVFKTLAFAIFLGVSYLANRSLVSEITARALLALKR